MKKYLLMMLTAATLFAPQEAELVTFTSEDTEHLHTFLNMGYQYPNFLLLDQEADNSYCELGHSKYKFDGGNVIVHAYDKKPYSVQPDDESVKVETRFFAVTTGGTNHVFGLNVIAPEQTYSLIVSRENSATEPKGPWRILASPAFEGSDLAIRAFCSKAFDAVPSFSMDEWLLRRSGALEF